MHSVEGNGFTLIGDAQVVPIDSLSHKLKVFSNSELNSQTFTLFGKINITH